MIKNYTVVYMCVDNPFCSTYCRDKHFMYIKNIDPDLKFPYKWYKNDNDNHNDNHNTKINCLIEIDCFKITDNQHSHSMKRLNRTQSLSDINTNTNMNMKREKVIVTCIKLHKFSIRLSNKTLKKCIGFLCIIMISILIKSNYQFN